MLSAEDDADDTIVPRLIAAGADLERIHFLEAVRHFDSDGRVRQAEGATDDHRSDSRAPGCDGLSRQ